MGNRWGNSGNSVRLYFLGGSKITADGDCSHEIKRRLFLGRKAMTNLDSIFKSRDITLPTSLVKAMVFPVVMYGCESWTVKKAECRRIDAFELWCWGRLLRVPWTARRSNQSILKEINPGISLEGMMLKLKLPVLWPPHAKSWLIGKDSDARWDCGQEEKGTTEDEMAGWHHGLDGRESEWTPGVYTNSCPLSRWCHPTISPSAVPFNLSQHQGLFHWVSSLHQLAKILEYHHQSFQWIFRTDYT